MNSWKWLTQLSADIWSLRTKVSQMATQADLDALEARTKAAFDAFSTTVNGKIDALKAELAAIVPASVHLTSANALLDDITAATAALNPPAPAPGA